MYITPRTLLGIIRLSQALAKLNFRSEVVMSDVDEALKLMTFSYRSLKRNIGGKAEKNKMEREERDKDFMSVVMKQVRDVMKQSQTDSMMMGEILKRLNKKGSGMPRQMSKEDLADVLDYYKRI